MAVTRGGYATDTRNGTVAAQLSLATIPDGGYMVAQLTAGTSGVSPATPPAGWTLLHASPQVAGSRTTSFAARIKQPGDTSISWGTTAGANKRLTLLWGEGAKAISEWVVGLIGVRNASNVVSGQSVQAGDSTHSTAPGITIPSAPGMTLSVFLEATTTAGFPGSVSAGGATLWFNEGDDSTYIEQHSAAYIDNPAAGTSAAVSLVYGQTQANNGAGLQIFIPSASNSLSAEGTVTCTSTVSATATTPGASGTVAAASTVAAAATVRRAVSGTVTCASTTSASAIRPGFTSVAQFLSTPGATSAWRLGGGPFPQHSMYAADRSVELGYGALEFSCGWTSDWATVGPFGLGPQYLDSLVGGSGNIDPGSMTFATMNATYQNRNNPVSPGVYQPFLLLTDLLAKYAATHLIIVDPKFAFDNAAKVTKMLDILDAAGGPTKFLLKFDSPHGVCQLNTQGHARGYTVMNYWGTDTTRLASEQSNWDILGMAYNASSGNWTAAKSYGKPIWAAVVPDQAAYNTAWTNSGGFDFANVSGVTSVTPVSVDYWSNATVNAQSSVAATAAMRTSASGATVAESTVSAIASTSRDAAGVAGAASSASAEATVTRAASATISATSAVVGSATARLISGATATSASTVIGTATSLQQAAGAVEAVAEQAATATVGRAATAAVPVISSLSALSTARLAATGTAVIESTVSAGAGAVFAAGVVAAVSTASATAAISRTAAASATSTSSVSAEATVRRPASGVAASASAATAAGLARLQAAGVVACTVTVSAVASASITPSAVYLGGTPVTLRLGDHEVTLG